MFKNKNLEKIFKLENQLEALKSIISEADSCWDFATASHYQKVYDETSRKLSTLKKHHKDFLESDFELVYSC